MSVACESYSTPVWLDLSEIDPRPACEVRVKQDEDAIRDYAEHWADLPPIKVAIDANGKHWTEDGAHRYQGGVLAGKTRIKCVIRNVKDYVEAFQTACRANEENRAVRITNADKRHRVDVALRHPEMSSWSNRLIAEHCGVSYQFVNNLRSGTQLTTVVSSRGTVGKDGKRRSSPGSGARRRSVPKSSKSPSDPDKADRPDGPGPADEDEPKPEKEEAGTTEEQRSGSPEDPPQLKAHRPDEHEDEDDDEDLVMKEWGLERAKITAIFDAWPDHLKGFFLMRAETLLGELSRRCPGFKRETVSLG